MYFSKDVFLRQRRFQKAWNDEAGRRDIGENMEEILDIRCEFGLFHRDTCRQKLDASFKCAVFAQRHVVCG